MFVVKMVILALGIAGVVFVAVRDHAARQAGWSVFASLLPLSLLAGATLVLASAGT